MAPTKSTTKPAAKKYVDPLMAGEAVFIRTVTHYFTGRVFSVNDRWIVLEDAAWVADTGRWAKALATGTLSEVEPYPDGALVAVAVGAVIDVTGWAHKLPRATK